MDTTLLEMGSAHDQVLFCSDRATGLKAFIALHDTSKGLAMGGTRMRPYATMKDALADALSLSRHMSYKARSAGIPIGGAKGVIIGDPGAKTPELLEGYAKFVGRLEGLFVTGQDMNMTREDIWYLRERTPHMVGIDASRPGPSAMAAYGVYHGLKAAVEFQSGKASVRGVRVAVQGVGSAGMELCRLLHADGARLVVSDVSQDKVNEARDLYDADVLNPDQILKCQADVFAPSAAGGAIDMDAVRTMHFGIVAGIANNQLVDEMRGAEELRARGILYCPDFVINAGGLLEVYGEKIGQSPETTKAAVERIGDRIKDILTLSARDGICSITAAHRLYSGGTESVSNAKASPRRESPTPGQRTGECRPA